MILRHKSVWICIDEEPPEGGTHFVITKEQWEAIKDLEYEALVAALELLDKFDGEII